MRVFDLSGMLSYSGAQWVTLNKTFHQIQTIYLTSKWRGHMTHESHRRLNVLTLLYIDSFKFTTFGEIQCTNMKCQFGLECFQEKHCRQDTSGKS